MASDIRPGWLLRQARELAAKPGRGRPRSADLRRAVSAAYYAVFHSLSRYVSQSITPDVAGPQVWSDLCRVWQHGDFHHVCGWISGLKKPGNKWLHGLVVLAQGSPELVRVAENFQALMAERHKADYDHQAEFRRRTVLGIADTADRTLADLNRIPWEDPCWQAFVNLVLLRAKVA